jgi:pilus assembly protein CpaF
VETVTSNLNGQNLSTEAMQFLTALMQARCNLFVCGDLLTDKSACLAYLESLIPKGRQVLHVDAGQNSTADATEDWIEQVRKARPAHVIVSSWHTGNFLDVLRLIGVSQGVLIATHGRYVRSALEAIDLLAAQTVPNLPQRTVREHLVAGLDVGIQTDPLEDGGISIGRLSEIQWMEGDVVVVQDIFLRDTEGQMKLRPTGIRPRLLSTLAQHGIELPETMFEIRRF